MSRRGFTMIELVIVVSIIAVIAAIAIPSMLAAQRGANERNAASSLRTLASAETDYHSNDRNGDQIPNYWCADVSGLYTTRFLSTGAEVRLIDFSIALADASTDQDGGGKFPPNGTSLDGRATSSKAGYWYEDIENGPDGTPYDPDDDDHNGFSFAFAAWPERFNSSGGRIFILNEENVVYSTGLGAVGTLYEVRGGSSMPDNLGTWPGGAVGPTSTRLWRGSD